MFLAEYRDEDAFDRRVEGHCGGGGRLVVDNALEAMPALLDMLFQKRSLWSWSGHCSKDTSSRSPTTAGTGMIQACRPQEALADFR